MWIVEGEKYAFVGLAVKFKGTPPPEKIAPSLWVFTDTTFSVPTQWREWLGSIRADKVEKNNLFLVSKIASATPGVLDGENQSLQRRVKHFYVGLLLSAMFSPAYKPVMLTGTRWDDEIGIRQQVDLELPVPQVIRRCPAIAADDIVLAAQLGQKLDAMPPVAESNELLRVFRTLHIYVKTRAITEPLDRIHQYCRCIEGLILPDKGRTKNISRAGPNCSSGQPTMT